MAGAKSYLSVSDKDPKPSTLQPHQKSVVFLVAIPAPPFPPKDFKVSLSLRNGDMAKGWDPHALSSYFSPLLTSSDTKTCGSWHDMT